jgi:hypothetical protein
MTDEELERLKNTNVDFGKVLKAATKVDPSKVKAKEASAKPTKKAAKKRPD